MAIAANHLSLLCVIRRVQDAQRTQLNRRRWQVVARRLSAHRHPGGWFVMYGAGHEVGRSVACNSYKSIASEYHMLLTVGVRVSPQRVLGRRRRVQNTKCTAVDTRAKGERTRLGRVDGGGQGNTLWGSLGHWSPVATRSPTGAGRASHKQHVVLHANGDAAILVTLRPGEGLQHVSVPLVLVAQFNVHIDQQLL